MESGRAGRGGRDGGGEGRGGRERAPRQLELDARLLPHSSRLLRRTRQRLALPIPHLHVSRSF